VFTRDEDRRGTAPLAVISYSFWKRNFDGDAGVIGKTVRLNRHTFEIVGVTPPWFRGLDTDWGFDVAIPIACEPILHPGHSSLDERAAWWLRIIARLPGRMPAGESVEQARDRMRAIAPEIFRATVPQDFPTDAQREYLNNSFFLKPAATGFSEMGAQYRTALYTLMAIVGVVLLIACANIANLLLARATARQREFSVRMAIGAGRARVIRQLMTESLLLSVFGTAAGLLLALWGSRLLIHLLSTTRHPLDIDLSLDPHVLAFTIGAAILTALLFGLAPALRATRVELNQVMKENTRTVLRASGRLNLGKALVAGQVALSLVLLVAAGLFLGTLRNLWAVDPGFTRHNILIITADVEQAAVPAAQRAGTYREILDRLRALPGVAAAASSVLTPISPEGWAQMVRPEGFVAKSPRDTLLFLNRISPGYFATLQTPLLLGRDFSDRDSLNAPKAMIVNESAARQFFGAANPIGKTIGMDKDDVYQIVGVVKDTKYNRINEQDRRIGYLADGQDTEPRPSIRFTLRSDVPVETLIPAARAAIGGVNHGISLEFRNLETQVSESLLQPRTGGAAVVRFRIAGVAAGDGGFVRDHVVCGDPAEGRDRDPDGAGRAARDGGVADAAGCGRASGGGDGRGLGRVGGGGAVGDESAIRRTAAGPGAACGGGGGFGSGDGGGGVSPCTACGALGSDGGSAGRVASIPAHKRLCTRFP
jgi:putative ABC transport system permease protein